MKLGHPGVVRVLCSVPEFAGVILDAEHGGFTEPELETLTALASLAGKIAVIRTRNASPEAVARALDRGASGVMIPRVRTHREVVEAISGARYSPLGTRGFDPNVSASTYGTAAGGSGARIFVEIETQEALEGAREIAAVEGVTDIFLGPADLARELGEPPGEIFTPAVLDAMATLPQCGDGSVRFGLFVDTPERAERASQLGYTFLAIGTDSVFLRRAAQTAAQEMAPREERLEPRPL